MKKLILLLLIPILISGQTVTEKLNEKIKKRFKEIHDAKIERLKECEDNKQDTTWVEKGLSATDYYRLGITSNRINYTIAKLPEVSYVFSNDSAKVTVNGSTYKTDLGIYQTMVLATIVQMWDEYAKECKADTVITGYSVVFDDSNNEPSLVGKMKPIYGQRTYPTLQGFIEFLRNKLKGE